MHRSGKTFNVGCNNGQLKVRAYIRALASNLLLYFVVLDTYLENPVSHCQQRRIFSAILVYSKVKFTFNLT